jgi:peptidoglycan-associated lipoprotein
MIPNRLGRDKFNFFNKLLTKGKNMKIMKLTCSLAFALAIALAATGCKNHQPVGVTPIPPGAGGMVGETGPGNTLPAEPNVVPTASLADFEGMAMDRAALAAYTIHFAYDSAAIRHSEQSNLQAVATALSGDPSTKLLIEGNCDERGTEEYNRALGERRALAAREALAKLGVDPSRIRTISYGKDKPVESGHDEAAWAKNRRDDFVLLHPKAGT